MNREPWRATGLSSLKWTVHDERRRVVLVRPYSRLMDRPPLIDTTFDVRTDAGGKDPDSHSKTLRRYHQMLWSKPLPSGAPFNLDAKLHHQSELGEFWLASDAITHTYSRWVRPARVVTVLGQIPPEEVDAFFDLGCTVGAYVVFPLQVHREGKWRHSINQARGTNGRIRDRFDLTLECIRRHYAGLESPLTEALAWHAPFFALFGSFEGYVSHFLLEDWVTADYENVRYLKDFDGFEGDPLPAAGAEEYREYMRRSMAVIRARNERIAHYSPSRQATS